MFDREKIEIRTLRNYLSSSEFVLTNSNSSVLFVPPLSSHTDGSSDFIPQQGSNSSSVAIRAAISGLDKELARLEREERLLVKFQAPSSSSAATALLSGEFVTMSREDATAVVVRNGSTSTSGNVKMTDDDDDDDDWEVANTKIIDTSFDEKNSIDDENETSYISNQEEKMKKLASNVVKRISTSNTNVKTELGVIGLALHTAILALGEQQSDGSEQYELFKCTGVPSDKHQLLENHFNLMKYENNATRSSISSVGGGGFAPPIRELPRGQLVPSNWEEMTLAKIDHHHYDIIAFRYKLMSTNSTYSVDSSTVLGVSGTTTGTTDAFTTLYLVLILPHSGDKENSEVHVSFGTLLPSSSTTTTTPTTTTTTQQFMTFPLGQYVNIDGYKAAKAKVAGGSVTPCLLYIALSELLYQFVTKFESVLCRRKVAAAAPTLSSSSSLPLENEDGNTNMTMDDRINCYNNSNVLAAPLMEDDKGGTIPHSIIPNVDGGGDLVVGPPCIAVGDDTTLFPPRGGDFESDLLPPGLPSLSVVLPSNLLLPSVGGGGGNSGGGSQVGPNHPMFDRTFGNDDDDNNYYYGGNFTLPGGIIGGRCGVGGGMDMGMLPQLDPYGPPGGPTESPGGRGLNFPGRGRLGRGGGRGGVGRGGRGRGGGGFPPPGGFGTPNNDHMTPPGGDYFS